MTDPEANSFALDSESDYEAENGTTTLKETPLHTKPETDVKPALVEKDTSEPSATTKSEALTEAVSKPPLTKSSPLSVIETEAETVAETVLPPSAPTATVTTPPEETPKDESLQAPPLPRRQSKPSPITTLREAFPDIEEKYIRAVLIASQGALEHAFTALLSLSDPSFEEPVPVLPTRRVEPAPTQVEADEELARRLAQEYEREDRTRRARPERPAGPPPRPQRPSTHRRQALNDSEEDTLDRFLEEDLPQFQKTLAQGVEETRTKLNSWVSGIAAKFSQDDEASPGLFGALGGSPTPDRNNGQFTDPEAERLRQLRQFQRQRERENERRNFGGDIALNDYSDQVPERTKNGKSVSFSESKAATEPSNVQWELLTVVPPVAEGNEAKFSLTDSEDEAEQNTPNVPAPIKADSKNTAN